MSASDDDFLPEPEYTSKFSVKQQTSVPKKTTKPKFKPPLNKKPESVSKQKSFQLPNNEFLTVSLPIIIFNLEILIFRGLKFSNVVSWHRVGSWHMVGSWHRVGRWHKVGRWHRVGSWH